MEDIKLYDEDGFSNSDLIISDADKKPKISHREASYSQKFELK